MAGAALTLGLFEFYKLAKRRDMKPNVVAMYLGGACHLHGISFQRVERIRKCTLAASDSARSDRRDARRRNFPGS
jgi:hypothetical protein